MLQTAEEAQAAWKVRKAVAIAQGQLAKERTNCGKCTVAVHAEQVLKLPYQGNVG